MITDASSLYSAWFGAMGDAFGAMWPKPGRSAGAGQGGHAFLPLPAGQIGTALEMLGGQLAQMLQASLQLLAKGEPGTDPFVALAEQGVESFERLVNGAGWPGATAMTEPNFERVFGGLLDAFGLRPTREIEQALREMLAAGSEQQRAQVEYIGLVAQACTSGTKAFVRELQAMGARGEQLESLLAFIRAWTKALDGPLHETMQSERGLQATAKVVRAATAYRGRLQKAVGLASDALNLPTRAELDDAYREIQELKREMRRLRQALPRVEEIQG